MKRVKKTIKRRNKKYRSRKIKKQQGGGFYEEEVKGNLLKYKGDFKGKRCLDIGTRNGLNCITMVTLGSREVIGIDIDDSKFGEMPANEKITLVKANLLDFNDEEGFDTITLFLWSMPFNQYDAVINKVKTLLKPGGVFYVGYYDRPYKYDKYLSVPILLQRHFRSSYILDQTSSQWLTRATGPIEPREVNREIGPPVGNDLENEDNA